MALACGQERFPDRFPDKFPNTGFDQGSLFVLSLRLPDGWTAALCEVLYLYGTNCKGRKVRAPREYGAG